MNKINVNPAWKVWDTNYLSIYIDSEDRVWSHCVITDDDEVIYFGDFISSEEEPRSKPLESIAVRIEDDNFVELSIKEARAFANKILELTSDKKK